MYCTVPCILSFVKAFIKVTIATLNPLTHMSDRDRISPYNINQTSDENKENYPFEDN